VKIIRFKLLIVLLLSVFALTLIAQDLHYSQFYTSPLNLNPSMTGIFNGDTRVGVNLRSQWYTNNLARYRTGSLHADTKLYSKRHPGFWSLGAIFNYDKAGDSKLGLVHFGGALAYTYPINYRNFLSGGVMFGLAQRRFRTDDLVWDSQWNGDVVDPSLPSGEAFDKLARSFVDFSAGLNYQWQQSYRKKFNLGVGMAHINRPNQSFDAGTTNYPLERRMAYHAMFEWPLLSQFDILGHVLYQTQGPYKELVYGGYGKFLLNQKRGREFDILLGLSVRHKDAIIPKIAAEWSMWYAGLSYDINISDFERATGKLGGPEFSLIYRIVHVQPIRDFKTCPIY